MREQSSVAKGRESGLPILDLLFSELSIPSFLTASLHWPDTVPSPGCCFPISAPPFVPNWAPCSRQSVAVLSSRLDQLLYLFHPSPGPFQSLLRCRPSTQEHKGLTPSLLDPWSLNLVPPCPASAIITTSPANSFLEITRSLPQLSTISDILFRTLAARYQLSNHRRHFCTFSSIP